MGAKTRASLVSEGLLIAGDTSITARANAALNSWLRSHYMEWRWQFLKRRITAVSLGANVTSLSFGAGSGGVTLEVSSIRSPIWLYASDYSARSPVRVQQIEGGSLGEEQSINNPLNNIGLPYEMKVLADTTTWGKWSLIPTPIPDKNYLLTVYYQEQPADIDETAGGDAVKPFYPNDRTMIQAIVTEAYRYGRRMDEYRQALDILAGMSVQDRLKYGAVPGSGDLIQLDQGTYPTNEPANPNGPF